MLLDLTSPSPLKSLPFSDTRVPCTVITSKPGIEAHLTHWQFGPKFWEIKAPSFSLFSFPFPHIRIPWTRWKSGTAVYLTAICQRSGPIILVAWTSPHSPSLIFLLHPYRVPSIKPSFIKLKFQLPKSTEITATTSLGPYSCQTVKKDS